MMPIQQLFQKLTARNVTGTSIFNVWLETVECSNNADTKCY